MKTVYPLRKLKNGDHILRVVIAPEYMEAAEGPLQNGHMLPEEFFTGLFERAIAAELARVRKEKVAREAMVNRERDIVQQNQRDDT